MPWGTVSCLFGCKKSLNSAPDTKLHADFPVFFGGGLVRWAMNGEMNGDVSGVLVVHLSDGGC